MTAASEWIAEVHANGNIAWVIGTDIPRSFSRRAGATLPKFEAFATNIFEKIGDRWLLVSQSRSDHPEIIVTINAAFDRS